MGNAKPTDAQLWALKMIRKGSGASPATLGYAMMEHPGCRKGYRDRPKSKGAGLLAGAMIVRLEKVGLTELRRIDRYKCWPLTKAKLTQAGREALAIAES